MIHSFSCKNFYSFAEESRVDFTVNDKVPNKNMYFEAKSGVRLNKAAVVIGPNASGKTNLLKVLPFIKWLIVDSFSSDPADEIPVKQYLAGEFINKLTELTVDFEIKGDVYTYYFLLNTKRIIREDLKVTNKTKQKMTTKTLFIRSWDEKTNKYEIDDKNFDLPKNMDPSVFRANSSLIGSAFRLGHDRSKLIHHTWEEVESNVHEGGRRENYTKEFYNSLIFFSDNEKLKLQAENLSKRFDLGLEKISINKEVKGKEIIISSSGFHFFQKNLFELPIEYESSGTRQFLILLKVILKVLDRGGISVIDEFDVNLHPDMVIALYDLFISPVTNPHNAQIIFSTHSHRILNELDKYQIVLTEKNEQGSSEAWRLDEMDGVRADDNYFNKYMAGAYGAVPRLD